MYKFNAQAVHDELVEWIRKWFDKNRPGCKAVIGISGGKDSSVVAALCVEALGKERVIGVLMPNGSQPDIDYSYELVEQLGIEHIVANISDAVNGVLNSISGPTAEDKGRVITTKTWPKNSSGYVIADQCKTHKYSIESKTTINLPARIRMATLYAVAQSVNGRVANTCNLSEDYVGYSTRYGDSVGDFSPLSHLTSEEVVQIGAICGLPDELIHKVPSDGLSGKTDEDNFGFTYHTLNNYIRAVERPDGELLEKIEKLHRANQFKLEPMPAYEPSHELIFG